MRNMTPTGSEDFSDDESSEEQSGTAMFVAAQAQLHRRVWMAGLWPAFRDLRTGETHLAMTTEGNRAVQHSFEGLPEHWVVERDAQGEALCLHRAIQAGYWRSPEFFALDATLSLPLDG